ncbi:hypothetical protein PS838_03735 [Pseudomonas fluorescens]|jgi:hypothetical protein|nr:hypothetical protein PS838_03735 [Pseudomonas fluorescens]
MTYHASLYLSHPIDPGSEQLTSDQGFPSSGAPSPYGSKPLC